ncbi:MAG: hypothetical protein ACJ74G_21585 [Blastocatellia bacterium]
MKRIGMVVFALSVMAVFISPGAVLGQRPAEQGASPQPPTPQRSSTAEETLVKMAYGKLSLYHRAANAKRAREARADYNPGDNIQFRLQDIHTGTIEEIYDRPWGEMVTKPTGDIVQVVPSIYTLNNGPESVFYEARWMTSTYTSTALEDWEHTTVGEALQLIGAPLADVGKYTSYEVTVHLAGRERTYRAMVLYHGPLQSVADAKVEILDNIVGPSGLNSAFREKRPPIRPSDTRTAPRAKAYSPSPDDETFSAGERRSPEIDGKADLSYSLLKADQSLAKGAQSGRGIHLEFGLGGMFCLDGFCCMEDTFSCDPTSCSFGDPSLCGPILPPYPPPPPPACNFFQRLGASNYRATPDAQYHFWGKHEAVSQLQNTCLINPDCSVICRVEINNIYITDSGLTSNACHVVGYSTKHTDGFPGGQASVGFGAKSCLLCFCNVNISFGIGGTTSDGFWTTEHTFNGSCSSNGTPTP